MAGTGKTFSYRLLHDIIRAKGGNILTCAFTGVAACLLPNGKTLHATFGLPVPVTDDSKSWFKRHFEQLSIKFVEIPVHLAYLFFADTKRSKLST